jgi:2-oxoglutarate ferredoxin oxidoreductase subunit alpha
VVVRFAGDSGDGMQLVGGRFTDATALLGNDLATLPDFPAEIRAPAGTIPGVSAFQIHFASRDILTPGDTPNVLVAMNPAALKANLATLERGAMIIASGSCRRWSSTRTTAPSCSCSAGGRATARSAQPRAACATAA